MTSQEVRKALPKPQLLRLKEMGGEGIQVAQVMGSRLLVKTVRPYTAMDRAKKSGLVLPEQAEQENTPLASTGVVLQLGADLGDPEKFPDNFLYSDGVRSQLVVEGSYVMFSKYAGSECVVGMVEDLRIMDLREILCTLTIPDASLLPVLDES